MQKTITGAKVITPKARLSFPALFKPDTGGKFPTGKYKATFLFDPKDEAVKAGLTTMKDAVMEVAKKAFGPAVKLSDIKSPFRKGDEKTSNGYAGTVYVTAKSKQRPGVVDQAVQAVSEESGDVYAGCYVRATLVPFSYDQGGNGKGVTFRLCNVQKLADGEPFGASNGNPEDDFSAQDGVMTDASEIEDSDVPF